MNSALRRFVCRVVALLQSGRADRELDREVTSHIRMLADEFEREGMTPSDAALAARRRVGRLDSIRDQQRDARSFAWLEDTRRDLQYAIRALARSPGFTLAVVLTLALGIGAVTAIYTVIYNVLLNPLPYRDSHRLVNVLVQDPQTGRSRPSFSPSEFLDFKEHSTVFEDVIGPSGDSVMYAMADRVEVLRAVWVTPNFFDFMGLPPLLGRVPAPIEITADSMPVVVLRHRAWVRYFNADPDIVGQTIRLSGEPYVVAAVMPPRFTWHAADVWGPRPVRPGPAGPGNPVRNFQARLKRGVTMAEAEAQLNVIAARRARQHPAEYPPQVRMQVANIIEYTLGPFSQTLYILLAAVALLLLIACCNAANMLLARASAREREMSIRAALGAGRGRIFRQLLVESILLSLIGAAAGCLLAYAGTGAIVRLLPQTPLPGEVDISLNAPVLAVSLAVAVGAALLFGMAPALYSARKDVVDALKSGGRGISASGSRLRGALVAIEIAVSLVLLLGAGLLMRTFVSVMSVDLGFEAGRILVVPLVFGPGQYTTTADKRRFYDEVLRRIEALPGIEAAAASTGIPPFSGGATAELSVPGKPRVETRIAKAQLCTPDYFRTIGIRVLRGRGLTEPTTDAAPRIAVISQTIANEYFAGENPIGHSIRLAWEGRETDPALHGSFEVVGVVEDVRNQGILRTNAPQVYLPDAAATRANPVLLIRTRLGPTRSLKAVRAEIAAVDRTVALRNPESLQDAVEESFYSQPRFSLIVLGVFAVVGTLLVAVGVFSVMAYRVARQTREIAVRMALGATRAAVLRLVIGAAARLLAVGIAVGIAASFGTNRLIRSQLWNTSPQDPLALAGALSVITVIALIACYIPARRAMRIDPMGALRQD